MTSLEHNFKPWKLVPRLYLCTWLVLTSITKTYLVFCALSDYEQKREVKPGNEARKAGRNLLSIHVWASEVNHKHTSQI